MEKREKYILCSHLLNNYSGSPSVLKEVIKIISADGFNVKLYQGNKDGEGFLSGLDIEYDYSFYRFVQNKIIRLLFLFSVQFMIFFKILITVRKSECKLIYANTLYSFGCALAGKLKGIKVVYHIHETYLKPPVLKSILVWVVNKTSSLNIYVSRYHKDSEQTGSTKSIHIYNSLSSDFFTQAINTEYNRSSNFTVLMVSSLKLYKGVNEFLEVAKKLTNHANIQLQLVLNDTKENIDEFFGDYDVPPNVTFFESQSNLIPFFTEADLVLNLTHADTTIETFGLTILEAITFGIPVICPTVGGPIELIDDGINGYHISCYDVDRIADKIIELSGDFELCMYLSKNAREKAKKFSPEIFKEKILERINE